MRILAIADEIAEALTVHRLRELRPELVVSCGDLPDDYLEYVVSATDVPLLYVPGNHDPARPAVPPRWVPVELYPDYEQEYRPPRPEGCTRIEGRVVEEDGMLLAGLGGCIRYSEGPNQYSQGEMRMRALALEARCRLRHPRRKLDVLLTHAPPLGVGDEDDPAHRGVAALHRLVAKLSPRLLLHGHVHPYGRNRPDRMMGSTLVLNVVPYRLLELAADGRGVSAA